MARDIKIELAHAQEELDYLRRTRKHQQTLERLEPLIEFDAHRGAARLRSLLLLAQERVPFYRSLQGVNPLRLEDFPLTRKADFRSSMTEFLARTAAGELEGGRFVISQTSGSTGQPVPFLSTVEGMGAASAIIAERMNRFHSMPETITSLNLGLHYPGKRKTVYAVTVPRPYICCSLRGFDPRSADIVADYEAIVGAFHVDLVAGSASRLITLARYCAEREVRLNPKAVVSTYEHMSESGRRLVEDMFGCKVTSLYGTTETGLAAWECRRGSMHFQDDLVHPELHAVDSDGAGDIILTNLMSRIMPIIRYITGDRAGGALSCDCGLPGSAITGLLGRTGMSLVGVDGELFSPYALLAALATAGVPDFQVIQREPGVLCVVLPVLCPTEIAAIHHINSRLSKTFGPNRGFTLEAMPTGEFALTSSGKRNPVIQYLEFAEAPETAGYID